MRRSHLTSGDDDSARGIDGDGDALVTKRRRKPAAGVRLNLVKLMVTTSCPGCASCRQIQASGRRSSCSATSIGTGERGARESQGGG
jgi:hypothetical protein